MTEPGGGHQPMEGVEDTVPAGAAPALPPAAPVVPPAAPVVAVAAPVAPVALPTAAPSLPAAAPALPPAAPVLPAAAPVLPKAAPVLPPVTPAELGAARAGSAPAGGPVPQAVPQVISDTAAKPPPQDVAQPAAKPPAPAVAQPAAKAPAPAVAEIAAKVPAPAVLETGAKGPAAAVPRSVIQATPQQPVLPTVKLPNLSIQAVTLAPPEGGEETKKVVPGLKIIGLSSEMRKAMAGEAPSDDEEDEDEDEDAEDEEDSDEDGEGEEDGDEGEEDEEGSEDDDEEGDEVEEVVPEPETLKLLQKTPKVTIRKVMKVDTPGGAISMNKRALMLEEADEDTPGKKRGRPSRAAIELRERERAEAIARGEPDPELKRKRRKPTKLADGASSEEETKEEKKKRKKEEREEKKRLKKQLKSEGSEDTEEDKPKKKKGRQKKELSEEQLKEREETRKEKYRLVREKAKAKAAKRQMYLIRKRDERKAQKLEERKRQEAHQKRMAELKMQYLDDNAQDGEMAVEGEEGELLQQDENSQSSLGSLGQSSKKRKNWGDVGMVEMAGIHNPLANVSAETLFEYKWPLEGKHSEHFFLQEQVTEFLGVKSFKRKYPECPRRTINMEERDFLIEMKIVNMTQADLGLTAIPSSSVLDIMCQDFYEHYEDYYAVVKERKERSLRNTNFSSSGGTIQSSEAVKLAAEYNKRLNADRKTIRTAYFDMQTFAVHYPRTNKGRMRVVKRAAPGTYPVAMIPGQFVDSYKTYGPNQLKHFPLNSVTSAPPPAGITTKDMKLGSEGSETDGSSSSSGSSSGSESDSDSDSEAEVPARRMTRGRETKKEEKETKKKEKVKEEEVKVEEAPLKKVDEVRPGTFCKNCQGNMGQNKLGQPEMLLHCTKCNSSCHPTCVGLHLDLVSFVTAYNWECTDCKQCMTCQDPADEDKMLFCDLCDRGYHIYCVGLQGIPTGRWHCSKCSHCESCGCKSAAGDGSETVKGEEKPVWAFETKTSMKGDKIYSHTMCAPCHKQWKKGTFCPDCNGVFGKSQGRDARGSSNCWVCQRQHHTVCVGLDKAGDRFICGACQRRTQEKTIAGGRQPETPGRPGMMGSASQNTPVNQFSRTPATTASYSRSGRRVTQINFANQF